MAYCGVIGHIARKSYAIIGPPVDKVRKIMTISYDKVMLAELTINIIRYLNLNFSVYIYI